MLRLFVPSPPTGDQLEITGAELHHLHTLRLSVGDRLIVFDATGAEHLGVVTATSTRAATLHIERTDHVQRESPLELILAPALLKARKLDWVIEKGTELGVARFAPFHSAHTISDGDHQARWERLALAAAKQSGRTRVPSVDPAVRFETLLEQAPDGQKLLAWEDETAQRLHDLPTRATRVLLIVGPEGGFAPAEIALARAHGFVTISFGPRILRAETAALVVAALAQHRWGDV